MFFVSRLLQLFSRHQRANPRGYYFLRYYKAAHRDRVLRVIQQAQIERAIKIEDTVERVPGKIGLFCRCDMRDAESLFFQHYSLVKQAERCRGAARPSLIKEC
jgi:hypothetical protein